MLLSHFQVSKCPEGTKPMLIFAGEAFDTDNEHKRLKSLLIGRHCEGVICVHLKRMLCFVFSFVGVCVSQTSSEVPPCRRCVWQVWNMFCTSLP